MNTIQKLEKLNKECKESISIVYHLNGWQIRSYEDDSLLSVNNKYPRITGKTFKECVDEAYKFVFKKD